MQPHMYGVGADLLVGAQQKTELHPEGWELIRGLTENSCSELRSEQRVGARGWWTVAAYAHCTGVLVKDVGWRWLSLLAYSWGCVRCPGECVSRAVSDGYADGENTACAPETGVGHTEWH